MIRTETQSEKLKDPGSLSRRSASEALDPLEALVAIGQLSVKAATEQELLDGVAERLASTFEAEYSAILEAVFPDHLQLRAGVGWENNVVGHTTSPLEPDSQLITLLSRNKARSVTSIDQDSWLSDVHLVRALGAKNGLGAIMPTRSKNGAHGLIAVINLENFHSHLRIDSYLCAVATVVSAGIARVRNEQGVRLLRETALAISSATDFSEALKCAMDQVCEITGWDYCESWIPSGNGSRLTRGQYASTHDSALVQFALACESMELSRGEGLPGRVWQQEAPEWIIDVSLPCADYERIPLAQQAGLGTALAIPLRGVDEVLAVLVFYQRRRTRRSDRMIELIAEAFRPMGALIRQKKLETVRARLVAIVDSSDDAILSTEMDGTIVSWNAGAQRIYGYTPEEIIGQSIRRLVPEERLDEIPQLLNTIRQGQHIQHFETVRLNKKGHRLYVSLTVSPIKDGEGRIVGVSSIASDVTRIKRIEREHAQLAAVVAGSQDAIISKTLDGKIVSWNDGAQRMYGYTAKEAVGRRIGIIVPKDRQEEWVGILDRIKTNEVISPYETVRETKDGSQIHIELSVSPVRDESGRIVGASAIARDISSRKEMQQALLEARDHLEHRVQERTAALYESNIRLQEEFKQRASVEEQARQHLNELARVARLSTMGEMASGLAHELNQPLCAIVNYTEACLNLIGKGETSSTSLADAMSQVACQAQRAGEVVRRLRDFIRSRGPDESEQDVNTIIRDVVMLAQSDLSQNEARIRLELSEALPAVYVDAIQIQQVLLNLIRNALDAMHHVPVEEREMVIRSRQTTDPCVVVEVSDRGCGLTDAQMDEIFSPFYTSKPNGMGMGLSISRSILAAHHGKLSVRCNDVQGVTFSFTLPISRRNQGESRFGDRICSGR